MEQDELIIYICMGILLGIVVAVAFVKYLASSLRSVALKQEADDYIVKNSLNILRKREVYTGTRTYTTRKSQPERR